MTRDRDFDVDPVEHGQAGYRDRYDHSYAIVVGIDAYRHPRLRPLGNAEEDARLMAQVLDAAPYDFQVKLLLGEQATRQAITRELNRIIRVSDPDDRVIFYFAGHGYIQPDNRGEDIGYLACTDTDPEDPFDGLEYEQVTKLTRYARAKHIAFIFDACFSGRALGLTRAAIQPAAVKEYLLYPAYQVLTAGAVEVVSDARSMTGELVQVLREGIPGQNTPLTFNHIGQYIHDVIHNQSRGRQSPIYGLLIGSSKGQMVLRTPDPFAPLPEDLRQGLAHPDPLTRRLAITEAKQRLSDPVYGPIIRAILADMQFDDDDRLVRRRARDALLEAGPAQPAAPAPAPSTKTREPAPEEQPTAEPAAQETKPKVTRRKVPPAGETSTKRPSQKKSQPAVKTSETRKKTQPAVEVAQPPLTLREQIKELARTPDREAFLMCPVCQSEVKARNLVQHYDRAHADKPAAASPRLRLLPSKQPQAGPENAQPSTALPTLLNILKKSRPLAETPKPQKQARTAASRSGPAVTLDPRQQIKLLARTKTPEDFLPCPVCNIEVKARNLVLHYDRTHAGEAPSALPDLREQLKAYARTKNLDDFLKCPVCQSEVKARNLVQHYDRTHAGN